MRDVQRPRLGEIWDATLDPIRGVEQAGFRPVLVISNDWFNHLDNGLVLVVPLTRTNRGIRYHVEMQSGDGGIVADSVVMCEQVRSIDRQRLKRRRGVASEAVVERVREIITIVLTPDPYME